MIYLIGDGVNVLGRARLILEFISGIIFHTGEYGQAATMKLSVNIQYGVQVAIWAETLAFLEKEKVIVLNTVPTTPPVMQVNGMLIANKNFMPMFPIEMVEKDFGYTEEATKEIYLNAYTLESCI